MTVLKDYLPDGLDEQHFYIYAACAFLSVTVLIVGGVLGGRSIYKYFQKYGEPDQYKLLQADFKRFEEHPNIRKFFRRDGYTSDSSIQEYIIKWEY